jgi:hypothetical protein
MFSVGTILVWLVIFITACFFLLGMTIASSLPNGGIYEASTKKTKLLSIRDGRYIMRIGSYCGLIESEGDVKSYLIGEYVYNSRKYSATNEAYVIEKEFIPRKSWKNFHEWGWGIDSGESTTTLYLPKGNILITE